MTKGQHPMVEAHRGSDFAQTQTVALFRTAARP